MATLEERVLADLDSLNALARRQLGASTQPATSPGHWVRCWDAELRRPIGPWHEVVGVTTWGGIAFRCAPGGLDYLVEALDDPERYRLQRSPWVPPIDTCVGCQHARAGRRP